MYDTIQIHLTNFLLCCACAGLKFRQIGNSLDDSAPAEDTPLESEKSCTLVPQAAQEMQEMQGSQCPQGALRLEVFAKDGQDSADGDGSLTGASLHLVGFCSIAQSSRDTIQPNQSKSKIPFQTR